MKISKLHLNIYVFFLFLSLNNAEKNKNEGTQILKPNENDIKHKNNFLMKKIDQDESFYSNAILNNKTYYTKFLKEDIFNINLPKNSNSTIITKEINIKSNRKNSDTYNIENNSIKLKRNSIQNIKPNKEILSNSTNKNIEKTFYEKITIKNNNKNKIRGEFLNEFATSFGLNFFSEIGDKSFIAIFLLTNQVSWVTLFLVASITEIIVNFLSVVIGYSLSAYESIYSLLIFITIFTTILFGFQLLKEAIYMEDEENEEDKVVSNINVINSDEKIKINNDLKNFILNILKIFWVVLFSELGDKSQIVTIILSTHHNPLAIFLGTAIAHVLGVLLSILLGNIVSSKVSNRIMNYIAASCFLGYGFYVCLSYFITSKIKL